MTGRTHALAGAALTGWVLLASSQLSVLPLWIIVGGIAGLLPDIDASDSMIQEAGVRIGRSGPRIGFLRLPGLIINAFFGHRGVFHSLFGLVLIGAILTLVGLPKEILWAFSLGYASHLLLDGLNPSGVPLLYPLKTRVRLSPFMKFRTGGWFDGLLTVVFSLGLAGLVWAIAYRSGAPILP